MVPLDAKKEMWLKWKRAETDYHNSENEEEWREIFTQWEGHKDGGFWRSFATTRKQCKTWNSARRTTKDNMKLQIEWQWEKECLQTHNKETKFNKQWKARWSFAKRNETRSLDRCQATKCNEWSIDRGQAIEWLTLTKWDGIRKWTEKWRREEGLQSKWNRSRWKHLWKPWSSIERVVNAKKDQHWEMRETTTMPNQKQLWTEK